MQNYKELLAWQEAMNVAEKTHILLKTFPKYEQYGLIDQIRRSSVSIPSNIAEWMQRTGKDQLYFLRIAAGSATELETQLLLAQRFWYVDAIQDIMPSLNRVMRLITGLKKKVHTIIHNL